MNRRTFCMMTTCTFALAAIVSLPALGQAQNTVSGSAYGLYSNVDAPVGIYTDPVPYVEIPPEGGEVYDAVTIEIQNLLKSDTAEVYAVGTVDEEQGACDSYGEATLEGLHISYVDPADAFILADIVISSSTSHADANGAFSVGDVDIIGLMIAGEDYGDLIDVAPNTVIDIPLVATVILNEQIPDEGSDGVTVSGLTVNAIHVTSNGGLLMGDIIVASSHSDVNCDFGGM